MPITPKTGSLFHAETQIPHFGLSKALGTMAGFWLNLQTQFDVATAEKAIGKALAKIVPISKDAA
jgi:plasmid maintenance system antidote protein VapI